MSSQLLAQQSRRSFLSILWANLQGEFSRSLEAGEFRGVVSVAASKLTGALVAIALGPVIGPFVSTISSYVIEKSLPVLGKSYTQWDRANYVVSSTRSGIVKLEKPQLVVPQRTVATLPKHLEIPTEKFIRPTREYLFNPSFTNKLAYKPRTQLLTQQTPKPAVPLTLGRRITPMNAVLSQGLGQTKFRTSTAFPVLTSTKINSSYRPMTDIVYPGWVFNQQGLRRTGQGIRVRTPVSQQNFGRWYLNDPQRASQFRDVARNISSTAPETYKYEPDFWDKVIDFLDDLFS